ncbi:hypothetical protein TraAM80_00575 [Trypanosoma rangeli]|uniref:Uncharacterized protein n=1 Tax=Trypanosoma rangeli TaxID=5698 RepID=A0A3R7MVM6_TRYRA|nr:uncharacterized protein TraAM80_00575 [Trypanosoma rangeli]RNF12015.1 hypothetical protein TraAM80_00575 [Trypanosoma rangeli]|eukprot:RNF12015.1 hypothetical protein TraAM80_00575 [Trypanosoma rangeli]
MTKLVRKLKQMAKKRAHRNTVLKRKAERAQKEIEEGEKLNQERLERETDLEIHRLTTQGEESEAEAAINKKLVRVVGDLVLETPQRKAKKQASRKQVKRKEKLKERGQAVAAQLGKKWNTKKRRVKQRAQARNENLQD